MRTMIIYPAITASLAVLGFSCAPNSPSVSKKVSGALGDNLRELSVEGQQVLSSEDMDGQGTPALDLSDAQISALKATRKTDVHWNAAGVAAVKAALQVSAPTQSLDQKLALKLNAQSTDETTWTLSVPTSEDDESEAFTQGVLKHLEAVHLNAGQP